MISSSSALNTFEPSMLLTYSSVMLNLALAASIEFLSKSIWFCKATLLSVVIALANANSSALILDKSPASITSPPISPGAVDSNCFCVSNPPAANFPSAIFF